MKISKPLNQILHRAIIITEKGEKIEVQSFRFNSEEGYKYYLQKLYPKAQKITTFEYPTTK